MAKSARTTGDLFCILTSFYWLILYIWNLLMDYFLHKPTHSDLFSILNIFLVSLSLHFMATWTYLWWPILYTNFLVLVNYSVYKELFDCLIFKHNSLSFIFFSIGNTSSWPSLYTSDFYSRFCSFTCPLWVSYRLIFHGYMYTYLLLVTHSVQLDYFEGLILNTYFPMFDLFSISTTSSWPRLYSLWNYFIEWYFMATCTFTFGDLFCTWGV